MGVDPCYPGYCSSNRYDPIAYTRQPGEQTLKACHDRRPRLGTVAA
jgi:hypothetical protein